MEIAGIDKEAKEELDHPVIVTDIAQQSDSAESVGERRY